MAVSHGCVAEAQGSRSKGPSAVKMLGGVSQSSDWFTGRSCVNPNIPSQQPSAGGAGTTTAPGDLTSDPRP